MVVGNTGWFIIATYTVMGLMREFEIPTKDGSLAHNKSCVI